MVAGIFLFQFGFVGDRRRVLHSEPQHFNHHPTVLGISKVMSAITTKSLMKIPFWIQLHCLPLMSRNKSLRKMLGDWNGDFIETDDASLLEGLGVLYTDPGC
ncbi:hypothetical protein TorRG33x02_198790 [Trema orientale]|uniref:Uncharacterized protein n=1 Tax=Trema orientale TaxID=63057 RepID=A0A2P5EFM5_TREOI|nr:hypothetical protein TorRG33x02_198790 [Trema orientale]